MRLIPPTVDVPGDSPDRIMARSGDPVGFDATHVVWRFGFLEDSAAARAYDVRITERAGDEHHVAEHGFLWVLATLRTGKPRDTYRGFASDLPDNFSRTLERRVVL